MSSDILLDRQTHDLVLLPDLQFVTGKALVEQQVKVAFLTRLGEWKFDTASGLDYLETVMVRNPDFDLIAADLRRVGSQIANVVRIQEIVLTIEDLTRELTGTANVFSTFGQLQVAF